MALTTEAFGLTDVGRKRQHNEDAMLVDVPLGLYVFRRGEQYAKRHGKLKRSG